MTGTGHIDFRWFDFCISSSILFSSPLTRLNYLFPGRCPVIHSNIDQTPWLHIAGKTANMTQARFQYIRPWVRRYLVVQLCKTENTHIEWWLQMELWFDKSSMTARGDSLALDHLSCVDSFTLRNSPVNPCWPQVMLYLQVSTDAWSHNLLAKTQGFKVTEWRPSRIHRTAVTFVTPVHGSPQCFLALTWLYGL